MNAKVITCSTIAALIIAVSLPKLMAQGNRRAVPAPNKREVVKYRLRIIEFESNLAEDVQANAQDLLDLIAQRQENKQLRILQIIRVSAGSESPASVVARRRKAIDNNGKAAFLDLGVTARVRVGHMNGKDVVDINYRNERTDESPEASPMDVVSTEIETMIPIEIAKPTFVGGTSSSSQLLVIVDK